jgi:hypothetical protein
MTLEILWGSLDHAVHKCRHAVFGQILIPFASPPPPPLCHYKIGTLVPPGKVKLFAYKVELVIR